MDLPNIYSFILLAFSVLLDIGFWHHKKWVQNNSEKIVAEYSTGAEPNELRRRKISAMYGLAFVLALIASIIPAMCIQFEWALRPFFENGVIATKFLLAIVSLMMIALVFLYQPQLVREMPGINNHYGLENREKSRNRLKNGTWFFFLGVCGTVGMVIVCFILLLSDISNPGGASKVPPGMIPVLSAAMIALIFGNFACVLRGFKK